LDEGGDVIAGVDDRQVLALSLPEKKKNRTKSRNYAALRVDFRVMRPSDQPLDRW